MISVVLGLVVGAASSLGQLGCVAAEYDSGDDDVADDDAGDDDVADDDMADDDMADDDVADDDAGDDDAGDDDVADDDTGDDDTAASYDPLFATVDVYGTTIAASGDEADVYYPSPPDLGDGGYAFPVALLLQGADVERQYYAGFASTLASYGFVVVVPDHLVWVLFSESLYAEMSELSDVIAHMASENADPASPVHAALDASTLVVLGHSYGGVCGMMAIGENCMPPYCWGSYTRPAELAGGVFWGTNLAIPVVGGVMATENDGLPVALVHGDLDGMSDAADALETYDQVADPPKVHVTVHGANHYGICDTNNPSGALADTSSPTLVQATAVETIARWSAAFLDAHVLGNPDAHDYVHVTGGAADPNVSVVGQP